MTVMSGTAGALKLGANTIAELDSWDIDFGPDLIDSASFGDTWMEKTGGLKEWSGKGSGRFDKTDTNGHVALVTAALDGTTVACRFYVDGTKYFSGTAYAKLSSKATVDGLIEVDYDFTGTGALTYV